MQGAVPTPRGRRDAVLVLIAAAALFGWRPGLEPPNQTAEARVPVAARSMAREGFSAIPRLGGEPWLKKPPLAVWLQALSMDLFGENLAAASLPGALLAAILAAAVARRGGLLAGLILILSPRYLVSARGAEMDIAFAALTGLAILRGLEEIRRRGRAGWASQLLLGLALIVKGPLCLAFALLAWGRGWRTPWAPLCLLPGAAWLGWAWREEPQVISTLWNEISTRIGVEHDSHSGPFHEHAVNLIPLAAPAVPPLALLAAIWAFRRLRGAPSGPPPRTEPPPAPAIPLLPLLSWLLGGLLLLSLLTQKQTSYLLPLYPALALLAARGAAEAERLLDGPGTRLGRRGTIAYTGLLLAAIPVFLLGILPRWADFKERTSLVPVGERIREWAEERPGAAPPVALKPKWEELAWGFGKDLRILDSIEAARSAGAAAAIREVTVDGARSAGEGTRIALELPHPRHPRRRIQVLELESRPSGAPPAAVPEPGKP